MKRALRHLGEWAIVPLLISLSIVVVLPIRADAQAADKPPLDHFKCYVTRGQPLPDLPVVLEDQFDRVDGIREEVRMGRAVRFCNAVEKIHRKEVTPIGDRRNHLKLYTFAPSELTPARRVAVRNQFGRQALAVLNPVVLAVPTEKNFEGRPDDLDHFKCYIARGRRINARVDLRDQFDLERHVRVLRPVLFCNPVEKTHLPGVPPTPILHPEAHLVCYAIAAPPAPPRPPVVAVNQFGVETLLLGPPDLLCVPSRKLAWRFEDARIDDAR